MIYFQAIEEVYYDHLRSAAKVRPGPCPGCGLGKGNGWLVNAVTGRVGGVLKCNGASTALQHRAARSNILGKQGFMKKPICITMPTPVTSCSTMMCHGPLGATDVPQTPELPHCSQQGPGPWHQKVCHSGPTGQCRACAIEPLSHPKGWVGLVTAKASWSPNQVVASGPDARNGLSAAHCPGHCCALHPGVGDCDSARGSIGMGVDVAGKGCYLQAPGGRHCGSLPSTVR